jgi:hypothetical protein
MTKHNVHKLSIRVSTVQCHGFMIHSETSIEDKRLCFSIVCQNVYQVKIKERKIFQVQIYHVLYKYSQAMLKCPSVDGTKLLLTREIKLLNLRYCDMDTWYANNLFILQGFKFSAKPY